MPTSPPLTTPPIAKTISHVTPIHGTERADDYFWLRDKSDPNVIAYLEAENAYAAAAMEPYAAAATELYDEMLSHIKQTDLSVPYRIGEYFYYSRTEEGKQYPILARKRASLEATEEVTLDLNVLAEGHPYFGLGAYKISPDGNLLAYSTDTTGYRQYTLHVRDLRTNADLPDSVARCGDIVWASDNKTLFHTTEDETSKRRNMLWRRELGAGGGTLVFEETDEQFDVGAAISNDREIVFVASYSKSTTHWQSLRADRPTSPLVEVLPRSEGHRYSVEHHGSTFFILTNRGAEDFRLVAAPDTDPCEARWREIVPERDGIFLADIDVFEHHLAIHVRSGGYANLEILDLDTYALTPVEFADEVHTISGSMNPEFHTPVYRFSYQSLITPASVYEIDFRTRVQTLLKQTEVPGFDASRYVTETSQATAKDGTTIPLSVIRRADLPLDGTSAMLLYAYGSYGHSIDPSFSPQRLVLLDRGVSFAIAHIRGGGELGEAWRTSGHLQKKLNTFEDFIAAAEHVANAGYTSRRRLAIQGGSAGGLLVSAVANMRPDLFACVVSQVPFVDVVNTMLDASLPLTTGEYLEWGNPNVKSDYDYMMRYSPYDNVRAQAYPAMLIKVSLNDSQVPYWEGAKLVAKLRALKTNDEPLYLVTNFGAGHGGASGRYDYLREVAADDAFILATIAPHGTQTQSLPKLDGQPRL